MANGAGLGLFIQHATKCGMNPNGKCETQRGKYELLGSLSPDEE